MLHPAAVSTLQSNLWTYALGCLVNNSGLMCLLFSCLLRLFTCTILMWWKITPYGPLCRGQLCHAVYGCCSHVPVAACAFSLWTFAGFSFLFISFAQPTSFSSFFSLQLPLEVSLPPTLVALCTSGRALLLLV